MTAERVAQLLAFNGVVKLTWSIAVGFIMLVPLQPWGKRAERFLPRLRDLGAAHLDWLMMALSDLGVAFVLRTWTPANPAWIAVLIGTGGWINPVTYVLRGYGINAFTLGGGAVQKAAATVGLLSSLALLAGWALLLVHSWPW